MNRPSRETFKTFTLLAVLFAGLFLVRAGALPFWMWALLTLLVVVMRVVSQLDRHEEVLAVGDEGVTRTYGSRMRKQAREAIAWSELQRVEAIAHETGPDRRDVLFLLYGPEGRGVAVPAPLAQRHDLVGQLRRRLPGFRDDQLAQAMAAADKQAFVLWGED